MNQALYDLIARWTMRVWAWVGPVLSWLILRDLQTLEGKGYWTFFWPVWLVGLALAVGLEVYNRKHP